VDAILAHFDGSVIIPDEPITLRPMDQVLILLDSASPAALAGLEAATRAYYQSQGETEAVEWGRGLAADSSCAWEEEP